MIPTPRRRRLRAYETGYQWAFQHVPRTILAPPVAHAVAPAGVRLNPARDSAVLVVHGMGSQSYTETAAELRNGFEDAIDRVARAAGQVLRPWPVTMTAQLLAERRHWWVNFFHVWDPVSGRLIAPRFFPRVTNMHSLLLRVPVWAHLSYWRDMPILTFIASRTYGQDILPVDRIPFPSVKRAGLYRILSLLIASPTLGALVGLIGYAIFWVLAHPDTVWKTVWHWVKNWLGL